MPEYEARPVPPRVRARVPVVSESATPREEVAMNAGTAVPPVLFARMELATAVVPNAVTLEPLLVTAPERFALVVTVAALPVMLALSDDVETWYVRPLLPAMRPESVPSTRGLVNVWVPPQVLEVEVPKASVKTAPEEPMMAGAFETESG